MKYVLLALLLLSGSAYTQTTFWVTSQNENELFKCEREGLIQNFAKALPDSKIESLQKVYEIETNRTTNFLRFVKSNKFLSKPQLIENFEPLYDPNDFNTNFQNDYALDLINAKEAWDITKGQEYIEIGVFDTAFDTLHEELAGKYTHVEPSNNPNLDHGTAVAITASGRTDNGHGKSSIGFNTSLALYRMNFNEMLTASYDGVRVINISWAAGCFHNPYYQDVINEIHSNGTVIVAAAGNGSTCGGPTELVYPAAYDHVIAVSSINEDDKHQPVDNDPGSCHQHNNSVDIVAPGYNIPLSIANNTYLTGNGTSFAAPIVSGVIGLMLSVNNCLTPDEIETILKETSVDIYPQNNQFLGMLGAGRVDAAAAVQRAKELNPIKYTIHTFDSSCDEIEAAIVSLDSGNISDHHIQWSDGNDEWSRYNLPSDNYSIMISNTEGCMVFDSVNYSLSGPVFDYSNSVLIDNNSSQIEDLNGDGIIKIKGTIVVQSGYELTLDNKTIEFSNNSDLSNQAEMPHSGIVVQPKARLDVKNSILQPENSCVQSFGGIEVLSNDLGETGELLISNCLISRAEVGVSNMSKSMIGDFNIGGGDLNIQNTTFSNNERAIHIEKNNRINGVSAIKNCNFIIDTIVANSVQIHIEKSQLKFDNNSISGNENFLPQQRGVGLYLKNSSLIKNTEKPNIHQYNNSFESMFQAIVFDSCDERKSIVENYYFNNNVKSIKISDSKSITISSSDFHIPNGVYPIYSTGIQLTGNSSSKIYENQFIGSGQGFNNAIVLNDQHQNESIIHSNKISGQLLQGVVFAGKNHLGSFACNDFNISGTTDVLIEDTDESQALVEIRDTLLLNAYSNCSEVFFNVQNESNQFSLVYRDEDDYLPSCTDGSVALATYDVSLDRSSTCESAKFILDSNQEENESAASLSNEIDYEDEIIIYPNPSDGKFRIKGGTVESVNIYDMQGLLISQRQASNTNDTFSINRGSGVYIIEIIFRDGKTIRKRLIIK